MQTHQRLVQGQIFITRNGKERTLNVRVATEHVHPDERDLVVTLDDITDLVWRSAPRPGRTSRAVSRTRSRTL